MAPKVFLLCVYGMKFPIRILSTNCENFWSSAVVQVLRFREDEMNLWNVCRHMKAVRPV